VKALAKAKGVSPADITVCVLDRPRHARIIEDLRSVGARVFLISDGDVAGVIYTADPTTGVDLYLGQGGAPEGVLAAAALRCIGGQFQGRLVFRNDDERTRAARIGVKDFDRLYDLDDLVPGDAVFAATGVTNGALVKGVRRENGAVITQTLVMNSADRTVRQIESRRLGV
jgi:fructose-1,6-bisphosphatase II / sedoheptulose-1,7-bisphosphatase